jgi:hypothetical protein
MGFQTGRLKTGGRQRGQPNKATLDIKAHARAVIEDPDYQAKLKQRLIDGSAPQLEILLHYYAYGRPRQEIDVNDEGHVTIIVQGSTPPPVLEVRPALENHSTDKAEPVELL